MSTPSTPPVVVDGLRVAYRRASLTVGRGVGPDVVRGVSFEAVAGQTVALVGQSGSGKSTIAHTIAGLLPAAGSVTGGSVRVHGRDVGGFSRRDWRQLHGSTIGFIPQDPLSSLDPLQRVGAQIAQSLLVHRVVPRSEVGARVVALLDQVGIPDPAQRAKAHPHQLSGGQLQRVLIAIAIAANPSVLIADEPTSALDVTVQQRILDLIGTLSIDLGLTTLLITHDLALAQERSDTLVVLEQGQVRDAGPSAEVVARPSSPYTVRLLGDAPVQSPDRYAHLRAGPAQVEARPVAVSVEGVTKVFGDGESAVTALDAVSLDVRAGTVHALVGESGSGKTTLARVVAGLLDHDAGTVRVGQREVPPVKPLVNRYADELQMVYQNPLAAVDPRFSVQRTIEEPLLLRGSLDRRAREARVRELLAQVALPASVLGRRARELSGGQRQRVAVARALVLAPRVLVLDEPTSALDVSIQAQVVDLLMALQAEHDLTYLFITHDLSLVRQIADRISVLRHGALVEDGDTREVFQAPQHPYTQRLLDAVPGIRRIREASPA